MIDDSSTITLDIRVSDEVMSLLGFTEGLDVGVGEGIAVGLNDGCTEGSTEGI